MEKQVKISVKGKVQGVFYRNSTHQKAVALGLRGHVKNLNDGSVEIVCQGSQQQIDELVSWCWEGPPASVVSDVRIANLPINQLSGFQVHY